MILAPDINVMTYLLMNLNLETAVERYQLTMRADRSSNETVMSIILD